MSISSSEPIYDRKELENILDDYESQISVKDDVIELSVYILDDKELGVILEYDGDERFIGLESNCENLVSSFDEIGDGLNEMRDDIGSKGYRVKVDEDTLEKGYKWVWR